MAVKMWSPKGNLDNGSTRLALTSGHSFIVPHDPAGIEVPARFQKEALSHGCLPVGMEPDPEDTSTTFNRQAHIREQMRKMMQSDDPAYFTTEGCPLVAPLSKLCGFQVDRVERDKLWSEVTQDPEGEKDEL